jgi:hypothetical protein
VWTVGISGINEIDIKLHGPVKNRERCFAIFWHPPDAVAGQAHGPETETMHGNLSAKRNTSS